MLQVLFLFTTEGREKHLNPFYLTPPEDTLTIKPWPHGPHWWFNVLTQNLCVNVLSLVFRVVIQLWILSENPSCFGWFKLTVGSHFSDFLQSTKKNWRNGDVHWGAPPDLWPIRWIVGSQRAAMSFSLTFSRPFYLSLMGINSRCYLGIENVAPDNLVRLG